MVQAAEATTTVVTFTPATAGTIVTPFSIPPLDPDPETADEIDVMLDEALDDDEVTADELAAVLEVAGVESDVAVCEADLLFELGVEDLGGIIDLQRAVDAMTDDQASRLQACFES